MTEIITNDPSSAVQIASPCLQHALGWSIRLAIALTQLVPDPVRNPGQGADRSLWWLVRLPWDPSSQGLGPKTLKILGPENHNRELLDPSSHPWGPVMVQRVRKAYRRKRCLHWKISKLHIIQNR